MTSLKEKVHTSLSEGRNLVLGAHILLGFQYEAVFRPGFERLSTAARWTEALALGLLLLTMLLLIAPAPFHRIVEGGEATRRQNRYTNWMIGASLVPFALALGANLFIVAERPFGRAAAIALALVATALALFLWFGVELLMRTSTPDSSEPDERTSPKDKINLLLTESRIILPGAQALLGFQLAAYLSDAFERLPESLKLAHTVSLLLIGLAVLLLMMPAPIHRMVYDGEDDPRFDRQATKLVIGAMLPLALGLAGDLYVVLAKITGEKAALMAAIVAALALLGAWFGYPLLARGWQRSA